MSDYTDSKGLPPSAAGQEGGSYPQNIVDTSWNRLEPLLTPGQLRFRHLFGIPLVSKFKDPTTGKPMVMTDPIIQDYIRRAVSDAELEVGIDIFPNKYSAKLPFDKCEYEQFGYFQLERKPVATIDKLTVRPADNLDVFNVPLDWVETAYMTAGQVNIIPLTLAFVNGDTVNTQGGGGAVFLSILGNKPWVPAFWGIEYTTGFKDGIIPTPVNELIGVIAAMKILSQLAATYAGVTTTSLGIDGLSQSIGTPGPQIFKIRMQELGEERALLVRKLKVLFGQTMFSGNV